jgi:hypothetical protein
MRVLKLEFYKMRRRKIIPMMLLLLGAEMLWAFTVNGMSVSRNPDQAVWESILFTAASMNGLFMPLMAAIVVSRMCDMEHKGATWKLLAALDVGRGRLYAAKYGCAGGLLLLVAAAQAVMIAAYGLAQGFPGGIPFGWLLRFVAGTMLTTLAIAALQQWIAMAVRNQAFALCLGMLGGFIGLTAGLFPAGVRRLLIWSYYLDLAPVTYRYAESSGAYAAQPWNAGLASAALAAAVLCCIAGSVHVARKEI